MDIVNQFCDTPFWDSNITWYTDNPDFTKCFKNTALQWIPCFYLWIFLPLELYHLKTSKMRDIPYNKLNVTKLVAIICIITTSVVELGDKMLVFEPRLLTDICSPIIKISSYMIFLLLTWGNIKMGIRSSGILFFFSFLLIICGAPIIRNIIQNDLSWLEQDSETLKRNLFVIHYSSAIIIFIFNCFADHRPSYSLCVINEKQCPSQSASFLSNLYFSWFTKYLWKGYKKQLKDILWEVDYEDSTAEIITKFEKIWNTAISKKEAEKSIEKENLPNHISSLHTSTQYSIIGPLLKLIWFKVLQTMFWRGLEIMMNLSAPLIFSLLITSISEKEPIWKAYFCVMLFFINPFVSVIFAKMYFETILKIQIHVRNSIMSLVYKKTLKISNESKKQYNGGDIVNFMSVDVTRICEFIKLWNHIWSSPAQIAVSLYLIWGYFGAATISSMITIGFILIANNYIMRYSKMLRVKEMLCKDKRIRFLQEILSGIKVLKIYAWESSFEKIAIDMRRVEMKYLKKIAILQVLLTVFYSSTPFVLPLITIVTYMLCNENSVLDVKMAFICVSFFNTFRSPMYNMPQVFSSALQALVSVKRINKFLNMEEIDPNNVSHEEKEEALIIENGTFTWEKNQQTPTLRNINLRIKRGNLIAIVGPVGCGKSSLISAFFGEMHKLSGFVNVDGSTAYVPQQAWILNTTVEKNITMGDVVDEKIYEKALKSCALISDLKSMHDGDQTEIGEKGINLSGGQKQRVSLARAICSNKDIYFFDDPLSAVDFGVAEHIFQNVLGPNGILKEKTRVLVTHSTDFLHKVDFIVKLKQGTISENGTFDEIMQKDEEFAEFLRSYSKKTKKKNNIEDELDQDENIGESDKIIQNEICSEINVGDKDIIKKNIEKSHEKHLNNVHKQEPKNLIQKERMETGNIKFEVYSYYIKTAGPFFVFCSIVFFSLFQSFSVLSNTWLAKWSTAESNNISKENIRFYYLSVYLLFGFSQEIAIVLANACMFKFLLKASVVLYNRMLTNVFRWPMSLFDSTPMGRIINRFTIDMNAVDDSLGIKLAMLLLFCTKFFAVSFVIISNSPICGIYLLPAVILMFIIQKFYMVLSHQLKRIDSVYRSPLYSYFVETIAGLDSIRAYNIQNKFIKQTYEKYNLCSATIYSIFVCSRWLTIRLDVLVGFITSLTSFFVISERDRFNEGTLAFIIAYTMQISKEVNLMITNLTEVENVTVSVERIKEFIDNPREEKENQETAVISCDWPTKGEITFENLKLRYRDDLNLVLKNVNFNVKSGEKVGIIGRTGAGKTSIVSALFRIVNLSDGKIIIDGVDISSISLHLLRSKLTVIPQDPVLFVGSLRFNLDPFDNYNDDTLWEVLEKAHLKEFVKNLPNTLQYKIEEGGGNLSFGQKQLFCLARALLRKTKVLVLDEATASVDLETDELIQKTIRKEFFYCTVLTIAHRLNTIQDYDKILVMADGNVIEFDKPENLLRRKDSVYYKLALESGIINN